MIYEGTNEPRRTVTYERPCLICGKRHQPFSKASSRCGLKLFVGVKSIIEGDNNDMV